MPNRMRAGHHGAASVAGPLRLAWTSIDERGLPLAADPGTLSAPAVPSPEDLFHALDESDLVAADDHWHLQVFSVTDAAEHRWLQVRLSGPWTQLITVRVAPTDPPFHVLAILRASIENSDDDLVLSHAFTGLGAS